ncbi:MAG: extracellular solute-binding protein [Candidatus Hydrogenedentes bacterium]|nr:extracellular solute-binding protein [Candidatus Hydrogenedentota bacterium]
MKYSGVDGAAWSRIVRTAIVLCLSMGSAFAETTEIVFFAAGYTPEINTGDNPNRLHEFTRIANEWESLHPGVKVVFVKQPVGDYLTWLLTQVKGGMGPDILWAEGNWCNDYAKNNWFVRLNTYLEAPNPYVPGNQRWRDLFYEHWLQTKVAPDGSLYTLSIDLNETGVYYNKDIFHEAGMEPPTTWAEMIESCRKLEAADCVPFAISAKQYGSFSWAKWALHDQLWSDLLSEIAVHGAVGLVNDQEMVRAYHKGLWSPRDPRYTEMLRILKDWSQYWNRDAMAGTPDEERLFRMGKAAMYLQGGWYMPNLLRDPLRTFEFGVFPLPGITKVTSPYGLEKAGPAPGVGGASATQYAITSNAARRGRLELAVDFMRFFTAPRNLERLVYEAGMCLPNGPGMKINPLLTPFATELEVRRYQFPGQVSVKRHYEHEFRVIQSYVGGTYTLEQAVNSIDESVAAAIDKLVQENPQWAFTPDWNILPDKTGVAPTGPSERPFWIRQGPWALPTGFLVALAGVVVFRARRLTGNRAETQCGLGWRTFERSSGTGSWPSRAST